MPQLLIHLFRLFLLTGLQIVIFSEIQIFGIASAFPFLLFLLLLPVRMPVWQLLLLGFTVGFVIDFFVGTYGLHAAAATLLALARNSILRFATKSVDDEEKEVKFRELTVIEFSNYTLLSSLVFCMVFFFLDYFSISAILRIGLQVIGSTIFTFVCIFSYRYLFVNQKV